MLRGLLVAALCDPIKHRRVVPEGNVERLQTENHRSGKLELPQVHAPHL
jgi:hypothetical protein